MHHAISFHVEPYEFLVTTARKKSLKHHLMVVKQGLVLVKLGKLEYAVEPGHCFWLPADTLVSLTFTPNTEIHSTYVSMRVAERFPKQAGYVEPNPLLSAILNRLGEHTNRDSQQRDLLAVVRYELINVSAELTETGYTKQINRFKTDESVDIPNELKLVLRVREANKLMLSGQSRTHVVDSKFEGDDALFTVLEKTILGR